MANKLKHPSELPVTADDMRTLSNQIATSAAQIVKVLDRIAKAIEELAEKNQN